MPDYHIYIGKITGLTILHANPDLATPPSLDGSNDGGYDFPSNILSFLFRYSVRRQQKMQVIIKFCQSLTFIAARFND